MFNYSATLKPALARLSYSSCSFHKDVQKMNGT